MKTKSGKNVLNIPYQEFNVRLDSETCEYFKHESKRSGLSIEKLITIFLRNDAATKKQISL